MSYIVHKEKLFFDLDKFDSIMWIIMVIMFF